MAFPMKRNAGFTLVELLTVIAIIGILATFVFAGVPVIIMRAQVADAKNTMNQIVLALEEYFTDNGSYPPIYGYIDRSAIDDGLDGIDRRDVMAPNQNNIGSTDSCQSNCSDNRFFVSRHYMHFLRNFDNTDLYDRFALEDNDTDFDQYISRLEYVPRNGIDTSVANYSTAVVDGQRPLIYIPVNNRQFKRVAREWIRNWQANPDERGPRPDDSIAINDTLQNMHFPPPRYDAFVLISIGPDRSSRGLLYDLVGNQTALRAGNYAENYRYHVAALASVFMATRDMNILGDNGYVDGDDELDFDFDGRRGGGQDQFVSNYYPNVETPGILGPIIQVSSNFDRSFEDGLLGQ